MRLLVSETDPLVRKWMGLRAEELGVTLRFASGSRELWRAIDEDRPDCVVLDASSSVDEPTPLWRQLRERSATRQIPVLLYSSSSRWQAVAEQAGATVDGYIPRPFTPEAVVDAARRTLSRPEPRGVRPLAAAELAVAC